MRKHRKMAKRYRKMPINREADRAGRILKIALVLLGLCVVIVGGYFGLKLAGVDLSKDVFTSQPEVSSSSLPESSVPEVPSSSEEPESSVPEPVSIHILGVGDNLIHDAIYNQASRRANGEGYDFSFVYQRVAEDIAAADVAVINQETILASEKFPPSNYPMFCTPVEMGDMLLTLGFDVVNQANNHSLDKGVEGIEAALDYWDSKEVGVAAIGLYRNDEDLMNIRIVEANGIKTAHIGFTEMTNGLVMPSDSPYRLVYASDRELLEKLVKKAKEEADVVVVSAHWGNENTSTVTQAQEELAQDLVNWGADIIFGNHAHAIQPLTLLTRESDGAQCPVIYAMGNFVSAQAYGINMVGGMLDVTMTKDFETGKTTFTDMSFKPVVTHYGRGYTDITIYPLEAYSEELAASHGVRANTPGFSMEYIKSLITPNIPEEYLDMGE